MIDLVWKKYNIITQEHFYHSGGKIENRNSMIEALVYNFDALQEPKEEEQLTIFFKLDNYATGMQ
jgi:DNA adenine methylase